MASAYDNMEKIYSDINKEYERLREEQRRMNEALKAQDEQEASEEEDTEDEVDTNTSLEEQNLNKENVPMYNIKQTASESGTNEVGTQKVVNGDSKDEVKVIELETTFKNQYFVSSSKQNSSRSTIPVRSLVFSNEPKQTKTLMPSVSSGTKNTIIPSTIPVKNTYLSSQERCIEKSACFNEENVKETNEKSADLKHETKISKLASSNEQKQTKCMSLHEKQKTVELNSIQNMRVTRNKYSVSPGMQNSVSQSTIPVKNTNLISQKSLANQSASFTKDNLNDRIRTTSDLKFGTYILSERKETKTVSLSEKEKKEEPNSIQNMRETHNNHSVSSETKKSNSQSTIPVINTNESFTNQSASFIEENLKDNNITASDLTFGTNVLSEQEQTSTVSLSEEEMKVEPKCIQNMKETHESLVSSNDQIERQKVEVNRTQGQNTTYPFITPHRRLPPSKVAQSLPPKALINSNSENNMITPIQRIMATVDMRSHLNTPMFQTQVKPTKATTKKRLLSTSNLISVPEDEDDDAKAAHKPLSEQRVEDVFKCICVNGVEYIVLNELGKGGSSVVYHCYDPGAREECAVKVVDLNHDSLGFINEVKALRRLQDCDRIIKLHQYEHLKEEKKLYMVLEKGGRDFAQILREHSRNVAHLPAFMVHFYWMQMLHAVRQMHAKGVIHSDLKPANFIEIRERLKLIDFGIASCVQLDMTSVLKTVALGTLCYISPEALCSDQAGDRQAYKISFRSDVWSLGCILYQLVYKRTPFAHIQHRSARLSVIMDPDHVISYPPAEWVPSGVIQCIRACLQYNARRRPTIEELIQAESSMTMTS